jgi:DNA-binding CsgD family transcriptional regulator
MWKRVAIYGVLLAAGTLGLQWLDYLRLVRVHSGDFYIFLIAVAFLTLGLYVGARVLGAPPPPANFDGNPKARAALGISASEMTVLEEIAAGHSNKEIAARLHISPNTVKTHASRLFEKLGAKRRTDAVKKARELGIVS